jgi:protein-disulfide isomerase
MNKRTLAYGIGIIAAIAAFWIFTKPAPTGKPTEHIYISPSASKEISSDKKITFVEYGDYQCPYCGQSHPALKQVIETYKDKVIFQYRNYPLTQRHPNALAAAKAAEAANVQGKFWEMHDKLYENQASWETVGDPLSTFSQYAKDLGLDEDKFKTDYQSSAINEQINADIKAGNDLKVTGTPTYILDGKVVDATEAGVTVESLSKLLDAAYNAKFPTAALPAAPTAQ